MNIGNIRHYIHIVLAITCLLGVTGRQHTAVAQSSARHYELGDVYIFPDGSKGVVCYVDPDNPHKGWAVSMTDLKYNNSTTFAICTTQQIESLTASLGLETVTDYNSWGRMDGWHDHGYANTKKLYDAHVFPSKLQNAFDVGTGWYIPDAQQLRLWFAMIPFLINKHIPGLIVPDQDSYNENFANSYWSSSVLVGEYTYSTPNTGITGLACMNLYTGTTGSTYNDKGNIDLSIERRIRLVREFNTDDPIAYWLYPDENNRTTGITVKNLSSDTDFDWNVVYGQDTFQGKGYAIVYPTYTWNQSPIVYDTVCQSLTGETYVNPSNHAFDGKVDITTPGKKSKDVTLQTVHGCDSVVRLIVQVDSVHVRHDTAVVCRAALPYVWEGHERDGQEMKFWATGEYIDHLTNRFGCDSIHYLHLTVAPMPEVTVHNREVCDAGTEVILSVDQCDSCYNVQQTILGYETFNKVRNTNVSTALTNDEIKSQTTMFQSGEKVFPVIISGVTDAVRLGNGNVGGMGYLKSRPYNMSSPTELVLRLKTWDERNVWVKVTVDDLYDTTIVVVGGTGYQDYHVFFEEATNASTFTITSIEVAMPNSVAERRFYIDEVTLKNNSHCQYVWKQDAAVISEEATVPVYPAATTDYTVEVTSTHGCVTTKTVNVRVSESLKDTVDLPICQDDLPITWRGIEFGPDTTVTKQYVFHEKTQANCDSTVILNLIVKPNPTVQISGKPAICFDSVSTLVASGDATEYEWYDAEWHSVIKTGNTMYYDPTEAGDSTFNVRATKDGCSKDQSYTVTVYPETVVSLTGGDPMCVGGSSHIDVTGLVSSTMSWNHPGYVSGSDPAHVTVTPPETMTFKVTGADVNNCPGGGEKTVTVNTSPTITVNGTTPICNGQSDTLYASGAASYHWSTGGSNDTIIIHPSATTTYSVTGTSSEDCVGSTTYQVVVNQPKQYAFSQTACDSYTWANVPYIRSGVYTQTFTAANGCDSVVTLTLTINYSDTTEFSQTACDSYTWEGTTYTQSGDYPKTLKNKKGCDSLVTMHLTINYSSTPTNLNVTECNSYVWHKPNGDTTITTSGVYTRTFRNVSGCDSVVTLNVTINHSSQPTNLNITECDSYVWHRPNGDTTITTNGVYTRTFSNVNGCDSVVTLNVTINHSDASEFTQTECNSFIWQGTTYTQSGDYTKTLTNRYSCDSVVTMHLTINYNSEPTNLNERACNSYVWSKPDGDTTITTSGVYTRTFHNVNGCDSVVTLNVTINRSDTMDFYQTECDSYTWQGETYKKSGVYTKTLTNHNDCDSVLRMHLTINYSDKGDTTVVACDRFTWHGVEYTETPVIAPTFHYTTVNGCDSVVTLKLTINHRVPLVTVKDTCDYYVWNGKTYTESGVYMYENEDNVTGCKSYDTLKLTIRKKTYGTDTQVVCDSMKWIDGVTYYSSTNTPTFTLTNAAHCDSIVTLNLTVNRRIPLVTIKDTCDQYVWNGQPYNATGVYTKENTDAVTGCKSVDTLKLTIRKSTTGIDEQVVCDSLRWDRRKPLHAEHEHAGLHDS